MTPRALALTLTIVVPAMITPAHAGVTAVFGGLRPVARPVAAAVCPAPAGPLATLVPIAAPDVTVATAD
jgi:hypothetical protein